MSSASALIMAGVFYVLGMITGWKRCDLWWKQGRPPVDDRI